MGASSDSLRPQALVVSILSSACGTVNALGCAGIACSGEAKNQ